MGLNNDETRNYLEKIGDVVFSEKAKVEMTFMSNDILAVKVHDESGHRCQLCKKTKRAFIEIINEARLEKPLVMRACSDCLGDLTDWLKGA